MLDKVTLITLLLGLSVIAEETEKLMDEQLPPCPPGYWCSKKRQFDTADCPQGFLCQTKRSTEDHCPPGFWVARRVYWCRRSELVIDKETDPQDCPQG